jgi:hypothetical protein
MRIDNAMTAEKFSRQLLVSPEIGEVRPSTNFGDKLVTQEFHEGQS